jgi:pimeloyl-ACP methyl ester carboxylesterase
MPKIKVNNINMYYEITGEGEPLVFIHGLGSSTRDWEEQIPVFSKDYKCITLDLRGHGNTDKPKEQYKIPQFAADVAELLKSLNVSKACVVGLSMGGATGFHLAIEYPELVKKLVVTNMSAAVPYKSFADKKMFFTRLLIVKLLGMKKMGKVIAAKIFVKQDEHNDQCRRKMADRWAENNPRAYLSSLRALKNWTVMDQLHKIQCPTLIVHSDEDYSPLVHKQYYTSLIPKGELIIVKDARHVLPMEKPEEYNNILAEYFKK